MTIPTRTSYIRALAPVLHLLIHPRTHRPDTSQPPPPPQPSKEELVATTVIIAPQAFVDDFPSFYETELFLEEHLEDSPLGEDVMVACFHPQYLFGGEPEDDPIHFEKRSPYPVFNLLRAQRVFQYADEGKTERIAANNQETLSRTGIAEVRRRFALEAPEEELEEGDGS